LGVENESRAGNAVEVDRIKTVSIEAGVAFVGSHTCFTLGLVAVSTVENFGSFIVKNVRAFRTFIEALD
jgi:hypothetical protein